MALRARLNARRPRLDQQGMERALARRVRIGLVTAALSLAPSAALACSLCVDMALRRSAWWLGAIHGLAGALLLELFVFGAYARIAKLPHPGRGRWLSLGIVLAFVGIGMSGSYGMSFGLSLALTLGLIRSVRHTARQRPRLAAVRVASIALVALLGLATARPAAQPTRRLVALVDGPLARDPVPAHLAPSWWGEAELARRAEAGPLLLARLADFEPSSGTHDPTRRRILRLLRAHAIVGGDREARLGECTRLGVDPGWGELVRSLNAGRVCGIERQAVAVTDTGAG